MIKDNESKRYLIKLLKVLFLLWTALICVGPFLWVIMSSFKTNKQILDSAFSLPTAFTFRSYMKALSKVPIFKFFGNSLLISVVNTVLSVFVIAMASYALARFNFRGKQAFTTLLSSSLLIPISALLMPLYIILVRIGLIDTKLGLILVYSALGLPTTLFILRGAFLGIPREIDESAAIDGASPMRTFFQIILPISKSGLATAATLHFIDSWNEFMFALVLTKSEVNRTLPLSLNYFTSQFSFDYPAMFAAITMAVLPSIAVYIALQEQITSSLVEGAVKG